MHLSDPSFDLMRQPQVALPDLGTARAHCGLGWMLLDYPGGPVIGQDGATIGQFAFLRVVPQAGIAVESRAGVHQVIGLLGSDSHGRARFLYGNSRAVARVPA